MFPVGGLRTRPLSSPLACCGASKLVAAGQAQFKSPYFSWPFKKKHLPLVPIFTFKPHLWEQDQKFQIAKGFRQHGDSSSLPRCSTSLPRPPSVRTPHFTPPEHPRSLSRKILQSLETFRYSRRPSRAFPHPAPQQIWTSRSTRTELDQHQRSKSVTNNLWSSR